MQVRHLKTRSRIYTCRSKIASAQTLHPDRARGIDRREQLRKFFQAVSAAELKKGVRAVDLAEGTKPEMVGALVDYFAAKRRRGNAVLPAGLAAGGAGAEEEQEAAL